MKRKKGAGGPIKKKKKATISTAGYQRGRELARPSMREKKAFDTVSGQSINFLTPANPPTFQVLNAMINGAELYQRVGRKTYMKSIHIRGNIIPITTSVQDFGRLLIFYDAQPNAANPTIATLLQDSNVPALTTVYSEINLINRARFKILRDYQVQLASLTNTAGVITNLALLDPIKNSFNINFFIKLNGIEAEYNGTNGGTIADISSGAILIVAVSLNTNNAWVFNYQSRLRYYD